MVALIFAPIKATLITVMVLTIVDLVSGLAASIKAGRPITSSGLKRTIVKTCVYEAVIMLGYLTEQHMTGDLVPVVKVLAGYIGLTELKSVMENLESMTGVSVLKALISKITQERNK
jgi:phage-related holin